MRLGLGLGYWDREPPADLPALLAEAERLGFESVWSAESYGSDAFLPLAWHGARTSLRLGTAVAQLSARTPAATAMAAMTLDHLSGGRFVLGLGASGPQVVEGWYGAPYPKPLGRTREHVEVVRRILRREKPLEFSGEHYALPYPGGSGLGKPLKANVRPLRPNLPIYLGAEGPRNVALAAEIADGWIPFFLSPRNDGFYRGALEEGFARAEARRSPDDFEVASYVPFVVDDDVERAADRVRPHLALYIGGMGARSANFHLDVFARLGYERECTAIQTLYLEGRKVEAAAAVPTSMVEDVALVGPPAKLRDELAAWRETVLDTMIVSAPRHELAQIAELILG